MFSKLFLPFTLIFTLPLCSQHEPQKYFPEDDPLVVEKLDQWQDMKFGLLMHWGPYSQKGIVESWSICPEDYGWCQRQWDWAPDKYNDYVEMYENLQTTFDPRKFDPDKWAKAASDAGMKYVVFTTKHHDGFCMFDSRYTDYKITDEKTPFHTHKKANVAREIFDAFRAEDMWTGAYFSKPDWHNEDYWWPYFPPKDRNVNYDPEMYPEKWENFTQFTHNQILELMTDYGKMDILWLDGGWVAKESEENLREYYTRKMNGMSSGFMKSSNVNQDIRMDELVDKARELQPGLIVVDRAVEGPNQNYLTPENRVPEEALPFPWESCIIAGGGWSYANNARYMSGHKAVHMLVDIVCKGGNLLLNIAPSPEGTWDDGAYDLLEEIGDWMEVNSEAIYGTEAVAPYKESKVAFTSKNDGKTIYAIYLADADEKMMPHFIQIDSFALEDTGSVTLLGHDHELVRSKNGSGILIEIPEELRNNPPCEIAWSFKLSGIQK